MAEAMECEVDPNICTECKQVNGEFRRARKLFCKNCWTNHCNFRFRKRIYDLGNPKKTNAHSSDAAINEASSSRQDYKPGPFSTEHVLIDFDGSTDHSITLLYLLRDAVLSNENLPDSERAKTLPFPFTCTILFVSAGVHENGEVDLNKKENIRVKNYEKLKAWYKEIQQSDVLRQHFPSVLVTSLEESLVATQNINAAVKVLDITEQIDAKFSFPFNGRLHEKLVILVEDLRTKTSRMDLLNILRLNLTKAIARMLNLKKILVTEDQTVLAVKMFSLMSLGRGVQLADEMNFVTNQEGVSVARPLMDLSSDDLRDYLKCMNLMEKSNPDVSLGYARFPTKRIFTHLNEFCAGR